MLHCKQLRSFGSLNRLAQKHYLIVIRRTLQLTSPEEDEILLLERRHLFDDGPEPALEGDEPVGTLAALVVERRVADQRRHVDVADL